MSHLPVVLSLENKKILLLGAGEIALNKLRSLLNFTSNIDVLSKSYSKEFLELLKAHQLSFKVAPYEKGEIQGYDLVIVALDDLRLQREIYNECQALKILCNCVDLQECCDFMLPSYIKEGDLTIAISTSGASPAFAKQFKAYLQKLLPSDLPLFLKKMRRLREELPKGQERMQMFEKKVKEYISSWS